MTTRPEPAAVRAAVVADAHGITRVHHTAWRETYTRLLPEGALDVLDEDAFATRWASIIDDDVTSVHVAERGGEIVGWCSASAGRDEDRPRDAELEGIYVLASEYGTGTGQALLDAAIADRPAYLWVADDNPRARAFYARNGFHPDGVNDVHHLLGHPLPAVRLVR
ncbi:GNAT family N-acetyltransferase [Protaetiibacter larvae]|uniref:GNAT family N-acetyltransferase n=1 Tax=Protaetiibacter larvae TaxID=2592654 RepID=A0A5C1YBU1_9MICO|nr:GNAT family N-acetyltransferase [Protaetiibacter larvae]QEO10327.1 GNAT family N-acetyltransferase [Protaetiibacter larvae]